VPHFILPDDFLLKSEMAAGGILSKQNNDHGAKDRR
jgi:hypothetical protein